MTSTTILESECRLSRSHVQAAVGGFVLLAATYVYLVWSATNSHIFALFVLLTVMAGSAHVLCRDICQLIASETPFEKYVFLIVPVLFGGMFAGRMEWGEVALLVWAVLGLAYCFGFMYATKAVVWVMNAENELNLSRRQALWLIGGATILAIWAIAYTVVYLIWDIRLEQLI